MPGAGTKPDTTGNSPPAARLLDLTRLIARVGRGPLTGIDRVERAYLTELVKPEIPLFVLVRTSLGFILLDAAGVAEIAARLLGKTGWGCVDIWARMSSGLPAPRKQTEADLRRFALARCSRRGLARMLVQNLPAGTAYLNVGHENLSDQVFAAVKAAGGTSVVLIHDTIALDYPQFQRVGAPKGFEAKLRSVGVNADLVIYNSAQSQNDAEGYFSKWGRVPTSVVAHLGIDAVRPDAANLPEGFDYSRPYFVCVGTIEPRKNHALLLDIWDEFDKTLARKDIPHLFIAGRRGWNNDVLFHRLETAPYIGQSVHEISGLDDAGLAALVQGSAGLLFPSLAEGFGLPPLEAAALGVPVVCGDLAIYREILGRYPVYAALNERDLWVKVIGELALKRSKDVRKKQEGFFLGLPTWEDHFKIVLNMT